MTREEAIQDLKDILEEATSDKDSVCYVTSEDAEALKMAIEALQSEVVMCKDCKWRKKNKFCLEHNRYEKNDDGYCHYGERGVYERK